MFQFWLFRYRAVNSERGGVDILSPSQAFSDSTLNIILADFCRHRLDLDDLDFNDFLVQYSFILALIPII